MLNTDYTQHLAQEQLRTRLAAFSIDDPEAAFPFSARLARENSWSLEYTKRVLEEYKRFLFLAMTAGHPVTPSVEVDQAWHLHLTYTRSYWEELVPTVLGLPLHHGPTKGGRAEGEKFHDWYARTLESYQRLFGESAPEDIWPSAQTRFSRAARIRQVSEATHWVIRKPEWRRVRSTVASSTLLLLAGCTATAAAMGYWILGLALGVFGIAVGGSILSAHRGERARRQVRRAQAESQAAGRGASRSSVRRSSSSSSLVEGGDLGRIDLGADGDSGGGAGDSGCGGGGCGGCGGCG